MADSGDHLSRLREMRSRAILGGGPKRIEQQHARGKLTARERLALLLDQGSFQEFAALAPHDVCEFGLEQQRVPGDGIVTGFGKLTAAASRCSPRTSRSCSLPFNALISPLVLYTVFGCNPE